MNVRLEQGRMLPTRRDGRMRRRLGFGTDRAAELNPLLSLVEDWILAPAGYVEHLHLGFETLTLVYAGRLVCTDTLGERQVLEAGDLQWVTAASEVTHAELADSEEEVHLVQLWLNLPAALKRGPVGTLTVRAKDVPTVALPGVAVRAIAGDFNGCSGAAQAGAGARVLELQLAAGASATVSLAAGHLGVGYVLSGEVAVGSTPARSGDLAHFKAEGPEELRLTATDATTLLLVEAPPLREPVVVNGPFVLNSARQLKEAWDSFRARLAGHPT